MGKDITVSQEEIDLAKKLVTNGVPKIKAAKIIKRAPETMYCMERGKWTLEGYTEEMRIRNKTKYNSKMKNKKVKAEKSAESSTDYSSQLERIAVALESLVEVCSPSTSEKPNDYDYDAKVDKEEEEKGFSYRKIFG